MTVTLAEAVDEFTTMCLEEFNDHEKVEMRKAFYAGFHCCLTLLILDSTEGEGLEVAITNYLTELDAFLAKLREQHNGRLN